MNRVALIDYGSGNVRSVRRALAAAAAHAGVEVEIALTANPEALLQADRIVLPGVGHFVDCAKGVRARPGLTEALSEAVRGKGRPFLGVCVGMQLMADVGLEDGETPGFGWIPGAVEKIAPSDPRLTIPHMGWNQLMKMQDHALLRDLDDDVHVYFTHSYVLNAYNAGDVAAWFEYGGRFTAAVAKDNLFGVQFHPEKSQSAGQRLLANFLDWRP